ncbi:hypothetical protein QN362_00440 [Actimicrobium sp. CCC2.4]|jgi:hypothetical protein|uniref:hypothetical protein n=1 Tax=Actimicrobium sp. CCC2.4 TaxID=3048606 RepID=UPI002AC8E1B1|nr:hypothetical protein [Actimicrobium sp. CCC2.4]MEB0133793.1 hypothetical protein [Actimicrobium sp. CCC2.4]WPX31336.1 hypothetical protein RHM62_13920 [Actimicrobium sp. CCC2.4]
MEQLEQHTVKEILKKMQYIDEHANSFLKKITDSSNIDSRLQEQISFEVVEGSSPDFLARVHHEICYVKFSHVVKDKQLMGIFQAFLFARPTFGTQQLKETAIWEFQFDERGAGKLGGNDMQCKSALINDQTNYDAIYSIASAVQAALQVN